METDKNMGYYFSSGDTTPLLLCLYVFQHQNKSCCEVMKRLVLLDWCGK